MKRERRAESAERRSILRRFFLCALRSALCALALPLFAQTSDTDRIIDRALASNSAWETLAHLTDNIGPRLSGSRNAAVAVKYG